MSLIDPEILIPSARAANSSEFWLRMSQWSVYKRPRVGNRTLEALMAMAADPPSVEELSQGDFWKLIGMFASRGVIAATEERPICETHLRADYVGELGDARNIDLLVGDLIATGRSVPVGVRSISSCWSEFERVCDQCYKSGVYMLLGNDCGKETDRLVSAPLWRRLYADRHAGDIDALVDMAEFMFPTVEFSAQAWSAVGSLSGSAHDISRDLMHHLGVLNDRAPEIWRAVYTTGERQAGLGSLGVEASLDSPNTHRNRAAMRARRFVFGSKSVICEWHTKLRPEINRIYFSIEAGKVRVGTIVDHLPV